jgi:DNA-binding response OmpR family regulator
MLANALELRSMAVKILVIEDDRKLARFLQRVLSEEGYTADRCSGGETALAQARSGVYNLILLDWMLPDLDGLELCRRLRAEGSTVPILMLTARGELAERVLALDTGVDDYLVKPFEVDELVARIHALLRRSAGHPQLRLGPLEIDRDTRRATIEGRLIDLTTREFSVLLHLAHRAGQAVTRTELLSQVWSTRFDPESNVVEVHISRLRDKLGPHEWMIQTVRGRGYRLVAVREP